MNTSTRNAGPVPPLGWNPNQATPVNGQPIPAPMQAPNPNSAFAQAQMQTQIPMQAQAPMPQQPIAQPPHKGEGAEQVIGRTVLGIAAAVLVFLGIVYFGIAVIPQLADEVKVVLMFAVSIILMGTGGVLAITRGGSFASAFMGCGACSLFASTLIAQMHFELINDVAAYAILLLWMIACLALIRKTQSVFLNVVLQVGLALSVWFACLNGMGADKQGLVLLYQIAASVIVVGGNMMFHRKMYRASLILAIVLNLTTSLCIQLWHGSFGFFDPNYYATRSFVWLAGSLGVQLLAAAVLVGMLSRDAVNDEVARRSGQLARCSSTSALVVASIAWFMAVKFDAQYAIEYCLTGTPNTITTNVLSAAVVILLLLLAVFVLVGYARNRGLDLQGAPIVPAIAILVTGAVLTALEASVNGGGIWTVCCMACALACIGAGFRFRINWLRLYGLITVLVCVAKLALWDIDVLDPAVRAATLIGGGLICFAVSALYTYAQRRLAEDGGNGGLSQ